MREGLTDHPALRWLPVLCRLVACELWALADGQPIYLGSESLPAVLSRMLGAHAGERRILREKFFPQLIACGFLRVGGEWLHVGGHLAPVHEPSPPAQTDLPLLGNSPLTATGVPMASDVAATPTQREHNAKSELTPRNPVPVGIPTPISGKERESPLSPAPPLRKEKEISNLPRTCPPARAIPVPGARERTDGRNDFSDSPEPGPSHAPPSPNPLLARMSALAGPSLDCVLTPPLERVFADVVRDLARQGRTDAAFLALAECARSGALSQKYRSQLAIGAMLGRPNDAGEYAASGLLAALHIAQTWKAAKARDAELASRRRTVEPVKAPEPEATGTKFDFAAFREKMAKQPSALKVLVGNV